MRRALSAILLVASCLSLWAQTLTNYQYWIDTDKMHLTTASMPSNSGSAEVNWSIPTGGLCEGMHTLFYRFQDDETVWSTPQTWQFFVYRAPKHKTAAVSSLEYWIDSDVDGRKTLPISGDAISFAVDTKSMREGLHTLCYRMQDNEGFWSATHAWHFFVVRTPEHKTPAVSSLEYWIDSDVEGRKTLPISGDALSFAVDTKSMREGLHTLCYRMQDNEGFWSATHAWQFFVVRTPEHKTPAVSSLEYWIDSDVEGRKTLPISGDALSFAVDTKSMREGLHTLCYRMQDNEGFWSATHAWHFFVVRTPKNATPAVSSIEYWVDTEVESRKTLAVTKDEVSFAVDTKSMREGLHTLCYRMQDNEGFWSATHTWHFFVYRIPTHPTGEVVAMEYWIDGDLANRKTYTITSQEAILSLEVMSYGEGDHVLYYRLLDNEGVYSAVMIHPFKVLNPYNPIMILPYDASTLNTLQKAANPDYMAYPTEIESQLPEIKCNNPGE